jgi:glycine/D-amino acid oxidase-like deaminating enzyme
MKLQSYWHDTAEPIAHAADRPVERHANVAVVRGGFTGRSAALHPAKLDVRFAVLERGFVGFGASGRDGGHLNKVWRIAS